MKRSFLGTTVLGSVIGISAGMYAMSRMSNRQRRRIVRVGRRAVSNMRDRINMF